MYIYNSSTKTLTMIQLNRQGYQLSILLSIVFFTVLFASCNSVPDNIPFPQKELSYNKPVSVPMVFTPKKKLVWHTEKQGGVTAVIKKLDFNTLPSTSNDSSGFRPFAQHRVGPIFKLSWGYTGARGNVEGGNQRRRRHNIYYYLTSIKNTNENFSS